ncbi:MAG TPA: hypothetical protein DG754_02630, partial [Bacteroidales bacterium]|nr:hypothetical protein [Bacteroidales bacterium]
SLVFMLFSLHSISQFAASTNKSPNYNEPDKGVKLQSFEVNFSVIGENGWLDAFTDEHGQFGSGTSIEQGTDVHFAAFPNWGYIVKEWRVNDVVIEGNTSNGFTYSNIQAPIAVSAEFKNYIRPEITPDKQYFGLNEAEDVNF